jgi:hypothetical protein
MHQFFESSGNSWVTVEALLWVIMQCGICTAGLVSGPFLVAGSGFVLRDICSCPPHIDCFHGISFLSEMSDPHDAWVLHCIMGCRFHQACWENCETPLNVVSVLMADQFAAYSCDLPWMGQTPLWCWHYYSAPALPLGIFLSNISGHHGWQTVVVDWLNGLLIQSCHPFVDGMLWTWGAWSPWADLSRRGVHSNG